MTWGNVIALVPSVVAIVISVAALVRTNHHRRDAEWWAEQAQQDLAEIRRLTGKNVITRSEQDTPPDQQH